MRHILSPQELADLFGVKSPDEIADDLYSDYLDYALQSEIVDFFID